jgi:hypothetical protein
MRNDHTLQPSKLGPTRAEHPAREKGVSFCHPRCGKRTSRVRGFVRSSTRHLLRALPAAPMRLVRRQDRSQSAWPSRLVRLHNARRVRPGRDRSERVDRSERLFERGRECFSRFPSCGLEIAHQLAGLRSIDLLKGQRHRARPVAALGRRFLPPLLASPTYSVRALRKKPMTFSQHLAKLLEWLQPMKRCDQMPFAFSGAVGSIGKYDQTGGRYE